jgi:hypothetical protein
MRLKRPSPSMIVAIAALVLAAGGFAVAAIPSADGTIHGCYATKGGALRIVKGTSCKAGEHPLSWNRGVARVTVRTRTLTIQPVCKGSGSFTICQATAPLTVRCHAGERATGGGYGQSHSGSSSSVVESKPFPTSGKPTGWTIVGNAFHQGSSAPPANFPIYAVCAN